jgi:hypothetical protein
MFLAELARNGSRGGRAVDSGTLSGFSKRFERFSCPRVTAACQPGATFCNRCAVSPAIVVGTSV